VVMGSIIFVAALGLIETDAATYLWKARSYRDLVQFVVATLVTFILEVELGVLVSVGMCVFIVLKNAATPRVYSVLGQMPGEKKFKDVAKFPQAHPIPGIILIRIDEMLNFANIGEFKLLLDDIEAITNQKVQDGRVDTAGLVRVIAINIGTIPSVDASVLLTFQEMVETYNNRGIKVCIIEPNSRIVASFERVGLLTLLGKEFIFNSNEDAITYIKTVYFSGKSDGEAKW